MSKPALSIITSSLGIIPIFKMVAILNDFEALPLIIQAALHQITTILKNALHTGFALNTPLQQAQWNPTQWIIFLYPVKI